jgi:hypothetical protein
MVSRIELCGSIGVFFDPVLCVPATVGDVDCLSGREGSALILCPLEPVTFQGVKPRTSIEIPGV